MGPIETEYGFYIIKLEDRLPERELSFEEVREGIKAELDRALREERRTEWIRSLRKKARIEYTGQGMVSR